MSTLTDLHEPETLAQVKPDGLQGRATSDLLPTFFADILLESDGQERRRRRSVDDLHPAAAT